MREQILKQSFRQLTTLLLTTVVVFCGAAIQAMAQEGVNSYHVGERIQYKASSYPEAWKEGTIIRVDPQYNQVIVRWDKDPNYPHGYEQAYNMTDVRHVKAAANEKTIDESATKTGPIKDTKPLGDTKVTTAGGTGLMTKQEILGYMRTHGYANGRPKKDPQVCKDLIEMMKQRGVKEPLEAGKDDLSPIAENGCYGAWFTDVGEASVANLGAPPTTDWLAGTWIMYVIGGTVDTAPGDGYIYRRNESIAKLGFLTIDAGGTYTWKVEPSDPPAKFVKGTWRNATVEEMRLQGGAGIVLQKGAEGRDWIVFKYQSRVPNPAERIDVQDLQYRGAHRRIGYRR